MTVLVNLMAMAVIAGPFVLAFLGWKYFSSPEARVRRITAKMAKDAQRHIESGNFHAAFATVTSHNAMLQHHYPESKPLELPALKAFIEALGEI